VLSSRDEPPYGCPSVKSRLAWRFVAQLPRDLASDFRVFDRRLAERHRRRAVTGNLYPTPRWHGWGFDTNLEVVTATEEDSVLARVLHGYRSGVRSNLILSRSEMRNDVARFRIRDFDIVRAIGPVIDDDADYSSRYAQRRKPVGDDFDPIGQMQPVRHVARLANIPHAVSNRRQSSENSSNLVPFPVAYLLLMPPSSVCHSESTARNWVT
jgi:hypothetical protein